MNTSDNVATRVGWTCLGTRQTAKKLPVLMDPQFRCSEPRTECAKAQFPGNFVSESGRRYYEPKLGRWLGRDPIEEKGGLHLYGFCENNAVNNWDLLGMIVIDLDGSGGGFDGLDTANKPGSKPPTPPIMLPEVRVYGGPTRTSSGGSMVATGVTFSVPVNGGITYGTDGQMFIFGVGQVFDGSTLPAFNVNASPLTPPTVSTPPSSVPTSIGQPGFWGGLVPFYGPGRGMIDDFQNGRPWSGVLNGGFLIADGVTLGVPLVRFGVNTARFGAIAVAGMVARATARRQASVALRTALIAAGEEAGENTAHHIVHWGMQTPAAQQSRGILERFGIGINSADNGVFVSQSMNSSFNARSYQQAVADALREVTSRDEALSVLQNIKETILRTGRYP